jgi:hypothetical protein
MDDAYSFFCGSVPILLLLWRGGGGPGPRPWILLLAGCIGGLASYMVLGPELAKGGGVLDIFMISIAGGAFAGIAADAALGSMAGNRVETRVSN